MKNYDKALMFLNDLKSMEDSKLPIWAREETRLQVLKDTKEEYNLRKNMLIQLLQELEYGCLTQW